jgi:hypothetical protein
VRRGSDQGLGREEGVGGDEVSDSRGNGNEEEAEDDLVVERVGEVHAIRRKDSSISERERSSERADLLKDGEDRICSESESEEE